MTLAPIIKFPQTKKAIRLTRIRKYMDQGTYPHGRHLLTSDGKIYHIRHHTHAEDGVILLAVVPLNAPEGSMVTMTCLQNPENVCISDDLELMQSFKGWPDIDTWNICSVCSHLLNRDDNDIDHYTCPCCQTRYKDN